MTLQKEAVVAANPSIFYLNMITTMGNLDDFSITYKDGYYYIAVGEHKYAASFLNEEAFFTAAVYIQSSIRKKEGW